VNAALEQAVRRTRYDMVWVDKAPPLRPATLARAKVQSAGTHFVFHSEDDHALAHNQWAWMADCFSQYDLVWTTKRRNVEDHELVALGARDVRFHFQSFDLLEHRPIEPTGRERDQLFADVGFIGSYEAPRAQALLKIAQAGVFVRVFGNGWTRHAPRHALLVVEPRQIAGREYLAAMASSTLQIGFLRRANRDEHTSRSLEIPACGLPLVAERSREHRELFDEGREARFFGDNDELITTVHELLGSPEQRRALALAGRERCLSAGYDHDSVLARCLASTLPDRDPAPAWATEAA